MPLNFLVGSALIGAIAFLAIAGAIWTPYNPLAIDLHLRLAAPSAAHWLGTDEFGRDVFSRIASGGFVSLLIACATVSGAIFGGTILGVISGFCAGIIDRTIMSITDALLAFPSILLAMGLTAVVGAGPGGIVMALALANMPIAIRLVRSTVLSLREKEFIEASHMIGNSQAYTIMRHILPNALAPIIVLATGMFGWALLSESALSFLGVGIAPPAPSWGGMLASSRPYIGHAIWLGLAPGVTIAMTLLGINLLGDYLRDRFDPRGDQ